MTPTDHDHPIDPPRVAHALEALMVRLQHVEQAHGLAIGHRRDDVGARGHVGEHVFGCH